MKQFMSTLYEDAIECVCNNNFLSLKWYLNMQIYIYDSCFSIFTQLPSSSVLPCMQILLFSFVTFNKSSAMNLCKLLIEHFTILNEYHDVNWIVNLDWDRLEWLLHFFFACKLPILSCYHLKILLTLLSWVLFKNRLTLYGFLHKVSRFYQKYFRLIFFFLKKSTQTILTHLKVNFKAKINWK